MRLRNDIGRNEFQTTSKEIEKENENEREKGGKRVFLIERISNSISFNFSRIELHTKIE